MPDSFAPAAPIVRDLAGMIRPPRRISVSECATEVVRIETPGGYSGPWDADLTPYMIEPMNLLKSRVHDAVVFASPARAGKTEALIDCWLAHCVTADPGDMGLYFSTQNLAYDYRKRRVERLHKHSPRLLELLSPRQHDTTIEMITYRHGMILNLGWPTTSQLAQRDLRYVALSDYDSFPDDVSGEGSAFTLAATRIQHAMSAGMALVESSPKREILTAQWLPEGEHEAPPVDGGILTLYNRGDRRRWYWQCIDGCQARFEAPALPLFDELPDIPAASATAHVACPHCGSVYQPRDKPRLNASGVWFREGERAGTPRQSRVASFWLLGCAAAMMRWETLVAETLTARRELERTGDETAIKAVVNTKQGLPYLPQRLVRMRGVDSLRGRIEASPRYFVPDGVRTLLGSVDVQANRFEVAIVGFGIGGEKWLVDRFRIDHAADGASLQPAVYVEHWDQVTQRVVNATYKLPDGAELRVYRVAIDSGGYHQRREQADSTRRAYDWWRSLTALGLSQRVRLIRGGSQKDAPMVRETFPDARGRSNRKAGSRGDVPVLRLNTDRLKDALSNDLARDVPGPGYVHLPDWLPTKYLDELSAEQRTENGWEALGGRRNETWDLLVYASALWFHLGGDRIRWERPPTWAAPWDSNSETLTADQRRTLKDRHAPTRAPTAAPRPSGGGSSFIRRPAGAPWLRRP